MTPLTDHELQALLSGDLAGVEADLADAAQPDLDAYREVWAVLELEPAGFSAGFADRVVAAVGAEPEPAAPARVGAWPLAGALAAAVILIFQDALATTFAGVAPTDALPWLAAALLAIACTDLLDRARRRAPGAS